MRALPQTLLLSALLLLTISPLLAQKPTPTPERNRQIVALLNDARIAAPELAVDTLLRVIESKKVKEAEWRRELLDEAWRLSDDVKYPVRKKRAYWGTMIVDTVSGYMSYAYDQKLDSLSLKARIIKNWLRDDKFRARQLAFQIGGDLKLKPIRCDQALSYVVDDIYESVGAIGKDAFSQKEIADGSRGLFILPWVENIESPTQIGAVMEMLAGLRSPPVERQLLTAALERSINRNFKDDRSFGFGLLSDPHLRSKFIRQLDDPAGFISAWREFLKKNLVEPRCFDSRLEKGNLPWFVTEYNALVAEDKRITVEDIGEVEYKGEPADKIYVDSEMYKKVSLLLKTAREKKNLPENREDKAAQLEWQIKITEVLDLLDSWKVTDDEPEIEVFNQKTIWYQALIREIAEPEIQATAMRAYMRYLSGSPIQKNSFIEWFFHARWAVEKYPDLFKEMVEEFPNSNFKAMVATRKVLLPEKTSNVAPK